MKGKKTGGRQKGTPNKENPLKGYIRAHSLAYFEPGPQKDAETGKTIIASNFDLDMAQLNPGERVAAELRLLEFHTPKMKAVDVDLSATVTSQTIEDRLRSLCDDPDDPDDSI